MSPTQRADVLVIGAGPVGLTLACELKRHGVRVRLVERKTGPNEQPNAAVVHVRTLETLCAMGAVEGFLREGYALPGLNIWAMGKRVDFVPVRGIDSPFEGPRTLGQQHTERLLAEHFERLGGRIERGVEALAVEQDEREARVRLKSAEGQEETAAASWIVGCEGSKSTTREAAGIPFEGKRYEGHEFLQVEANLRWSHPHGMAYGFFTGEHALLIFPYDDDLGFCRIICARKDRDPENHEPPTLEEMQEIIQQVADPCAELSEPRWFNRFRTGYRFAPRFREGRLFLAGDAGHVHVPLGGQGMNYGIQDAFNLGWKMAAVIKGEAPLALLDSYNEERNPVDEALIHGTDRGFQILMEHPVAGARLMRVLGPLIFNIPALTSRLRNTLAEMTVAYPTSALSQDHGGSAGPAAGDRAPDAIVVRMPERKTAHLFDVFHGTRWTLLLFAGRASETRDLETLERLSAMLTASYGTRLSVHLILGGDPPVPVHENWAACIEMDRQHYAHDKYGVDAAPCLYLIRPDWYVGFRGGLEQHGQLSKYLARVFT